MIARPRHRLAAPALLVALGLGLAVCGGDDDSPTSATPPPTVGGSYFVQWTLQVLRKSDGFQKQFVCYGTMTLVQAPPAGSTSSLSGFAVVNSGCAPESYDLTGSVSAGGAIAFTTSGPKPPEGPCPGGKDVPFTGQVSTSGSYASLSTRGVTSVTCPEFGEHEFTYLINASK
ncbi:MAG TPA: hypothetical protein VLL75_02020 [Vicinamibacteria bacterium]|jgi:hypothetical protein|nr:hypothetical protein [Vicinamibacteria bacterium]